MVQNVKEETDKILDERLDSAADESNLIVRLFFEGCLIGSLPHRYTEFPIYADGRRRSWLMPCCLPACFENLKKY